MKQFVKILFFVSCSTQIFAQMPAEEPIDYIYKKHWFIGPQLSTTGAGLMFALERGLTDKFKHGVHISIANLKAYKETRKTNSLYENSRSYVFGKINSAYVARLNYAGSWLLFENKRSRGVRMHLNVSGGPVFGFVKPIYLRIKEPYTSEVQTEPVDTKYDPTFHFEENIYGRSTRLLGFDELKTRIGLYAKTGLQFDFSSNKNKIIAVELGLQMDMFRHELPLFYTGLNKKHFPGLYASLQFGMNKVDYGK